MQKDNTFLFGCLVPLLFILLTLMLIKKLWWFIVGITIIFIVGYYARLTYETIKQKKMMLNDTESDAPMGEVYKVCPYCNTQVKVTETTCPNCKKPLN